MMKLGILSFLLFSVHRSSSWRPVERTRLYRLTEAIGRWSMVDIYVVTILVALVRFGDVVDFIDWYYRSFHWPTFNIADSAISIGVGLLAIDMLFSKPQRHRGTEDGTEL